MAWRAAEPFTEAFMTDEVVEQVEDTPVDPAVVAAVETPEVAAEPEAVETPAETKAEPKPKTPWFMERINEETNKKREAEERARKAESDAEQLRALLEAAQKPDSDKPAPIQRQVTRQDDPTVEQKVAQALFARDTRDILDAGNTDFDDFQQTVLTAQTTGMANDDFIMDLIEFDKANAHKILHNLAKDPEQATKLVKMSTRARIAALTRMTMAQEKPPTTPPPKAQAVSKAPPPKQGLDPVASGDANELGDDITDEEFNNRWNKKYLKRA